jgi:hypothetical protein
MQSREVDNMSSWNVLPAKKQKARSLPKDEANQNHRNKWIGEFYIVCRANMFWHVEFRGESMYTNLRRNKAVKYAHTLQKEYERLGL